MQQSKAIQDDSNVQFILPDTSGKLPAVTHSEDIISQTIFFLTNVSTKCIQFGERIHFDNSFKSIINRYTSLKW